MTLAYLWMLVFPLILTFQLEVFNRRGNFELKEDFIGDFRIKSLLVPQVASKIHLVEDQVALQMRN